METQVANLTPCWSVTQLLGQLDISKIEKPVACLFLPRLIPHLLKQKSSYRRHHMMSGGSSQRGFGCIHRSGSMGADCPLVMDRWWDSAMLLSLI